LEELANGPLPQFAYQIHLASGEVEKTVKDEQSIRQFLKGLYGAKGPNGELAFDPVKGVLVENLPLIGESKILSGKVSFQNPEAPWSSPHWRSVVAEGRVITEAASGLKGLEARRDQVALDAVMIGLLTEYRYLTIMFKNIPATEFTPPVRSVARKW
jgi:hypothetical protein